MMRPVSEKESLRFLKARVKNAEILGINWSNHRPAPRISEDTYRFTAEIMSLEVLIGMLEHKKVKNVFWHPSAAPPGAGIDGIALRYRIYVQYNKVRRRTRAKRSTSS